jgi:hypothetical protein
MWLRTCAFIAVAPLAVTTLDGTAQASLSTPQRSLRALGGRPVWVPICSKRGVNGSAAYYDAVNTSIMDQVMCYAPSWGSVTAIKLLYAAFDMPQQGEVDRNIIATIANASIFVPTLPSNQVYTSTAFNTSSTYINCSPTAGNGCNSVSAGQLVSSAGTYFGAGTYVTSVVNSFAAGGGNLPTATQINLSSSPTAANSGGLAVTFTGQIIPARWGGNRGVAVVPAHDIVSSDPVTVTLPPNTQYFVRTAATMSGAGLQISDYPGGFRFTGAQNEFDARSTSLNDQTMAPTNVSNTGGGFWGPVAVLGLVTPGAGITPSGAVLVLGDSIAAGTGDLPDNLNLQGYVQRSLENNVPFVTAARGSTTASEEALQGAGQFALATDTGITDVLLELGRNDIQQFSASAATLETYIGTIASRYGHAGKRVWCFTIPPTTISGDGWTTLLNQSWINTSTTTTSASASGTTSIALVSVTGITIGQAAVIPPPSQSVGSVSYPANTTSITLQSTTGLYGGQAVYGSGIAAGTTISNINGLTLTLSHPTSGAVAALETLTFGTGLAPGTKVTAVNTGTNAITIAPATIAAIPSSTVIYTGSQIANSAETARETYNTYLRGATGLAALGCYGLVDDDAYMADLGGSYKWRVDLGAGSIDGVHPAAVIHSAVVNAGVITPAMFYAP